jgi:coenzyme F420-reducing hydrogenase beta subunit
MYFVVGTPCQIDSIRRWVKKRKMNESVILLDFFCHGVPSMLMWNKYLSEVEKKIGSIDNIVWRDKETGWHDSWVMKVGERYSSRFSQGDLFYRMYLKNRCLAKPCYEKCKFKGFKSAADIRIGDLWGGKYAKDEEGVSGVIGLTRRGVSLLKDMNDVLYLEPSTADIICESQMKKCAHRPLSYGYVMKSFYSKKSLGEIDRVARIIEMVEDVPSSMRYYASRLPVKLSEIIKRATKKS